MGDPFWSHWSSLPYSWHVCFVFWSQIGSKLCFDCSVLKKNSRYCDESWRTKFDSFSQNLCCCQTIITNIIEFEGAHRCLLMMFLFGRIHQHFSFVDTMQQKFFKVPILLYDVNQNTCPMISLAFTQQYLSSFLVKQFSLIWLVAKDLCILYGWIWQLVNKKH